MTAKHRIDRGDIMPMAEYGAHRAEHRRAVIDLKRHRRLEIGPSAALYFENHATMLAQIHEMLWIEGGGEAQIDDELAAYGPLVPRGRELVATLMFEIDDPVRRDALLRRLAGVEDAVSLEVAGAPVRAVAELQDGVERTKPDGKTSSIHFLHFPFAEPQIAAFREDGARIVAAIEHPEYAHMAVLPEAVRAALADDFD
ncbi:MAG: DUF3501 family protein [Alphaproteobacteria bacterium]|mgnify:CR=1 FL=1|jgi:hypothetical protein|nr:DUF3501 family protein [Alphaproteobacteria bacterium]MDP6565133.1 DUF3501 family protein [Alphaproteobacteria bacterium]MDP6815164.1 DUF3501 family protein [Alphaproteobacteria bacterium]